eukprot:Amastigsp_a1422_94.p6 type:complete len:120 gc:universal Amastigsp_a1422_94:1133-774(-)
MFARRHSSSSSLSWAPLSRAASWKCARLVFERVSAGRSSHARRNRLRHVSSLSFSIRSMTPRRMKYDSCVASTRSNSAIWPRRTADSTAPYSSRLNLAHSCSDGNTPAIHLTGIRNART